MHIDAFIAAHAPSWQRLDGLTRSRASRGATAAESAELLRLYEETSSHLAIARRDYHDRELQLYLSRLIFRAGGVVHARRAGVRRASRDFWVSTFPAAIWTLRRPIAIAGGLFFGAWAISTAWILYGTGVYESLAQSDIRSYVDDEFVNYYSDSPAQIFFLRVALNNTWIALQAFAAGIVFGIPAYVITVANGAGLGYPTAIFQRAGDAGTFWGYILPHGFVEISCIIIAAGAGFALGWTLLVPGARPRATALQEAGQRGVAVIIGIMVTLTLSAIIEAYVTPMPGPRIVPVTIGAALWGVWVWYLVRFGQRATAAGRTGLIGEEYATPVDVAGAPVRVDPQRVRAHVPAVGSEVS